MFRAPPPRFPVALVMMLLARAYWPDAVQADPVPPAWQLGGELSPIGYRHRTLELPEVRGPEGFGGQTGLDGEKPPTKVLDGAVLFPAELGMLASRQIASWLAAGLRLSFSYVRGDVREHQSIAVHVGPFLRATLASAAETRLTLELGGNFLAGRDSYRLTDPSAESRLLSPSTEESTHNTLGGSLRAQLGAQWFLSETISVDPAVRGEFVHYSDGDGYTGHGYQLLLVVGMSIWLGDDPVRSPRRHPAGDVRDQFQPSRLP
ncbi:MAG: hypothetical protein OXR73_00620 [Myxococcales bacterium]|nr:hypothetical protein [Myxococcales bacterium]